MSAHRGVASVCGECFPQRTVHFVTCLRMNANLLTPHMHEKWSRLPPMKAGCQLRARCEQLAASRGLFAPTGKPSKTKLTDKTDYFRNEPHCDHLKFIYIILLALFTPSRPLVPKVLTDIKAGQVKFTAVHSPGYFPIGRIVAGESQTVDIHDTHRLTRGKPLEPLAYTAIHIAIIYPEGRAMRHQPEHDPAENLRQNVLKTHRTKTPDFHRYFLRASHAARRVMTTRVERVDTHVRSWKQGMTTARYYSPKALGLTITPTGGGRSDRRPRVAADSRRLKEHFSTGSG
ncbi:hypothetical protein Bbelb_181530 [Branchiostoma belcheri]|nr:hypothetical protein Bbelb_181530 [Branchiostoma belcheri]